MDVESQKTMDEVIDRAKAALQEVVAPIVAELQAMRAEVEQWRQLAANFKI